MDARQLPANQLHKPTFSVPLGLQAPGRIILALLIAVVVLAVNFPVFGFDWLMFDDDINILINPHLGCRAPESFVWAFENVDYMRRYLPLGWIGFAGLLAIDGYNPALFHAANWLLCGLNAALMFLLLERLLQKRPISSATPTQQRTFAAAVGALFWSLHPLRVETIAWISGFLYVGSTSLALAAVYGHLRASAASTTTRSRRLRIVAALLYLGSVLVYPVHLALPAVLVCALAALSPSGFFVGLRTELKRTAGWWLAAAFSASMNVFARATASEAYAFPDDASAMSGWEVVTTVLRTVAHYIARTLWPGELSAYYGAPDQWLSGISQQFVLGVAVLITAICLFRRTSRHTLFGWASLAGTSLIPFLVQIDRGFHPSDRYSVLWLGICATAIAIWLAQLQRSNVCRLGQVAALLVLLLFAVHSRRLLPNWKNTATLQASVDRQAGDRPSVQFHYARAAVASWWLGDRAALQHKLDEAIARYPGHPAITRAQATLRELDSRWRARVGSHLDIPPLAVLHVDIGRAWQARRRPAAATAHFARALRLAPDYLEAQPGWRQTNADE